MIQAVSPRDSWSLRCILANSEFGRLFFFSEVAQSQLLVLFDFIYLFFISTVLNLIRKFISVRSVIIKLTQPSLMKEGDFLY